MPYGENNEKNAKETFLQLVKNGNFRIAATKSLRVTTASKSSNTTSCILVESKLCFCSEVTLLSTEDQRFMLLFLLLTKRTL